MTRDDAERLVRIEMGVQSLIKRDDDKERRLRKVEKRQWYHTGGLALAGFIFAKLGIPWPWPSIG